MVTTIITLIVAISALMNAIGYDFADIVEWFANGRIIL